MSGHAKSELRDKPKHSAAGLEKGHGLPKKGGAGGKGTWGAAGDDGAAPAALDPHDPNYDSSEEKDEEMRDKFVYYIVPEKDWNNAVHGGSFGGSEKDKADGFIHLSDANQVAKTGRTYYKGVDGLLLVELTAGKLGDGLVYEDVKGEKFPHFYGNLPTKGAAVSHTYKLPLRADGSGQHTFPNHLQ